jgi:hypothetical protein
MGMTNTLHEEQYTFFIIAPSVILVVKNVSDKRCGGNQNKSYKVRSKSLCT